VRRPPRSDQRHRRAVEFEPEYVTGLGQHLLDKPAVGLGQVEAGPDAVGHQARGPPAGNPCPGATYPFMLRCSGCTLEVDTGFKNPSEYGLTIPDFWN